MTRALSLTLLGACLAACSPGGDTGAASDEAADPVRAALSLPPVIRPVTAVEANPRRGRILFITDGCVICHQVNGVGGLAGPSLDAAAAEDSVDPLAFSARIWRGARAMTALQAMELGYVIDLDGQDIADLAAFVASPDERPLLTLDSVSREMRTWFINEPYWIEEDWDEYRERGETIPLGRSPQP